MNKTIRELKRLASECGVKIDPPTSHKITAVFGKYNSTQTFYAPTSKAGKRFCFLAGIRGTVGLKSIVLESYVRPIKVVKSSAPTFGRMALAMVAQSECLQN